MGNKNAKERAYKLSIEIIQLIRKFDQKDIGVQVISRQVVRSGTSIGANIIEAQSGSSKKDFVNFLRHSLKSANETVFWLELLKDTNDENKKVYITPLIKEVKELANILASSIITAGKNK